MATRLGTGDTVDGSNYLYIDATTISQNTSTRVSTVTWHAYWHFSSVGCRDLGNLQFTVNGAKEYTGSTSANAEHTYSSSHSSSTHPNLDMASGSFTVQHDGNGVGSFTCSGTCTGYSGAVSNFATHTVTLAEISTVPDAPGLSSVTQVAGLNALDVVYTGPADDGGPNIDNYIIQYANNSSFTGYTNVNDTGGTYRISNLAYGQIYYVRVYAHNSIGNSGPSTVRSATTAAIVPSTMAVPTISAIQAFTADVNFVAPAANGSAITSYEFSLQTTATVGGVTHTDTASPLQLLNLTPAKPYWIWVRAKNAVGSGAWSGAATFTTAAYTPDAPVSLVIVPGTITPVAAGVDWAYPAFDGGSAVTSYTVEWALNSAFTGASTATTSSSSSTLTNLKPSTTYYVRVRANNAIGNGAWATAINFKTLAGAYISKNGQWVPALVYVSQNGQWVLTTIKTSNGTAWK